MTFSTAVRTCFRKYARFIGRASRQEFWWFWLFLILGGLVVDIVLTDSVIGPVNALLLFTTTIPALAVMVRRLHDIGRSGWWPLLR